METRLAQNASTRHFHSPPLPFIGEGQIDRSDDSPDEIADVVSFLGRGESASAQETSRPAYSLSQGGRIVPDGVK
jgi:hypothetical protein